MSSSLHQLATRDNQVESVLHLKGMSVNGCLGPVVECLNRDIFHDRTKGLSSSDLIHCELLGPNQRLAKNTSFSGETLSFCRNTLLGSELHRQSRWGGDCCEQTDLLTDAISEPWFNGSSSHANSILAHSHKGTVPVADTFSAS